MTRAALRNLAPWVALVTLAGLTVALLWPDPLANVPYQPVVYVPGQQVQLAYKCGGLPPGTTATFEGMDGTDVQVVTDDGSLTAWHTIDRRCIA